MKKTTVKCIHNADKVSTVGNNKGGQAEACPPFVSEADILVVMLSGARLMH